MAIPRVSETKIRLPGIANKSADEIDRDKLLFEVVQALLMTLARKKFVSALKKPRVKNPLSKTLQRFLIGIDDLLFKGVRRSRGATGKRWNYLSFPHNLYASSPMPLINVILISILMRQILLCQTMQ